MPSRDNAMDKGTKEEINAYNGPGEQHVQQFLHQVMENKRKRWTKRAVSNS